MSRTINLPFSPEDVRRGRAAPDVNVGLVDFLRRQRMSVEDMRRMAVMLNMAADLKQRDEDDIRPPRSND